MSDRLDIRKTYKLYVGGQFRTAGEGISHSMAAWNLGGDLLFGDGFEAD